MKAHETAFYIFCIFLCVTVLFAKGKKPSKKGTVHTTAPSAKISADTIVYYETVPDAPISKHFVSEILINGKWCKSATLETECSENEKLKPYIRPNFPMTGWTMSWTSFEIPKGKSVQLRIKRIDGLPFDSWSLKPRSKNIPAKKEGDWLVLTIDKPCQLALDPSNELNDFNLGKTDPSSVKFQYRPRVCGFLEKGLSCDIVFLTKNTYITGDSSHAKHYSDRSA